MRLFIAILVGVGASLAAVGRAEIETVATEAGSGVAIEVEGWTGLRSVTTGRDAGLIPVTVTITNGTTAGHTWAVASDERFGRLPGVSPSSRITVPAGGTAKTTLFVGCAVNGGGHSQLRVAGHAVNDTVYIDCRAAEQSGSSSTRMFPSGISKDVQAAQGDAFENFALSGNPLDMARAPEDWRGWSAFRNILMSEGEWRSLAGGRRKAMLDWVSTGGRVGVLVKEPTPERLDGMGIPAAGPDERRRLGAGEVVVVPWDGKTLTAKAVNAFRAGGRSSTATLLQNYQPQSSRRGGVGSGGWDGGFGRLVSVFGERSLPVGWILGFLTLFGIVAGPVNVMVLAGKGRRSRMFWTTPLISLAATVFLLLLMFMRDGVGGAGARRVLGLLAPEQNTMSVIQEQFSRTGVLLGSSFPILEPSWLEPIDKRDWNDRFAEVDGRTRQGDWFRSRSDQAYLAVAVRPSRARLEVEGGSDDTPPAVLSSIEVPLDKVFVIDEEGRYWTADGVGTGQKKPLQASDAETYQRWFESLLADAGAVRRDALDPLRNIRGHAYATSSEAGKVAVRTLGAIRWVDERADFVGPFTRSRP
jgi:hypothetical protein